MMGKTGWWRPKSLWASPVGCGLQRELLILEDVNLKTKNNKIVISLVKNEWILINSSEIQSKKSKERIKEKVPTTTASALGHLVSANCGRRRVTVRKEQEVGWIRN